jgi:hypothetical protein
MDLAKKYLARIFIYQSTFLGCYIFYAIIILLEFFDVINLNLSVISNALAIYEIVLIVGSNLVMLYFGAQANDQYVVDQLQLAKMKQCLIFIRVNFDTIMDPAYDVPDGQAPLKPDLPIFQVPYLKLYQRLLFAV